MKADKLRREILSRLPPGKIVPEHTEKAHFYRVDGSNGPLYPSVTGKLQILKDEGLMNWKMNRALEYVSVHLEETRTPDGAMRVLDEATMESQRILEDAGDIGTLIHDSRERYFADWIETGERPKDPLRFLPDGCMDRRAVSGMRALSKFCEDTGYVPVVSELLVYSDRWQTAGALDDIGLIGEDVVLMDLKTSNRFKDHYFFQVAMYWEMFRHLTDIKPSRVLILKVSKENGSYSIEDLKDLPKLVECAEHLIEVNKALEFVGSLRKDNQRKVVKL